MDQTWNFLAMRVTYDTLHHEKYKRQMEAHIVESVYHQNTLLIFHTIQEIPLQSKIISNIVHKSALWEEPSEPTSSTHLSVKDIVSFL